MIGKKIRFLILGFCISGILPGTGGCMGKEEKKPEEEKVVLGILAGQSTSDAGIEDMITETIQQRFPQVELEWECVDWGENFDDSMRARLSSGDIPDIIMGKSQDVPIYAGAGILSEIKEENIGKIKKQALETVKMNGKIYGIPYNAWYQGVIYNKEIFRKYNLEVPQTQKELQELTEILETHDITPFAGHFQEDWKTGNLLMQMMLNEIFLENPGWGDDFRAGKTGFLKSYEARSCFTQIKYIYEHSFSNAALLTQAESDRLFEEGEAAMYPGGCWSLQFVNQLEGAVDYGIFPYPNRSGDSHLIRETNITFMKSRFTENPELVDEIFKVFAEDTKLMEEILEFTKTFSVREDVKAGGEICISEDIEAYEQSGRVIEAAVGNSQIIWNFQNHLAGEIMEWLKEKQSLEAVLTYGDEHREESMIKE